MDAITITQLPFWKPFLVSYQLPTHTTAHSRYNSNGNVIDQITQENKTTFNQSFQSLL